MTISVVTSLAKVEEIESKSVMRLIAYNKDKIHWMIYGSLAAILNGSGFPILAIFLGKIMIVLNQPDDPDFNS